MLKSVWPIGIIITGNLFIKATCWELQWSILVSSVRSQNKNSRLNSSSLVLTTCFLSHIVHCDLQIFGIDVDVAAPQTFHHKFLQVSNHCVFQKLGPLQEIQVKIYFGRKVQSFFIFPNLSLNSGNVGQNLSRIKMNWKRRHLL